MPEMPAPTMRTSKCSVACWADAEMAWAADIFIFAFVGLLSRTSFPWRPGWPQIPAMVNPCARMAKCPRSNGVHLQSKTPLSGGLQDPVAVKCQRRHAGQAAAARAAVGSGRPADDTDDHRPGLVILNHRTAGIAGAGPQAIPRALPGGIDQANLQGARRAGRDQIGGTNNAAALAVTAHGHADAGDGELVAGREGKLRDAERGCGLPTRR